MLRYPTEKQLQKDIVKMTYCLRGVPGMRQLLSCLSIHGMGPICQEVVWHLCGLAGGKMKLKKDEVPELLVLTVIAMSRDGSCLDLQCACLSLLQDLIRGDCQLGAGLLQAGGGPALVAGMDEAAKVLVRSPGDELSVAVLEQGAKLILLLLPGTAGAGRLLREVCHIVSKLSDYACCLEKEVFRHVTKALGQVGGPVEICKLLLRVAQWPESIHDCLNVLNELVWKAIDEDFAGQADTTLKDLIELLLTSETLQDKSVQRLAGMLNQSVTCVSIIGGLVNVLAPSCRPGDAAHVDQAVMLLVRVLDTGSIDACCTRAADCLGHVAMTSPVWRSALGPAVDCICRRIRVVDPDHNRLPNQKSYFWALAAINVDRVVVEMRHQPHSTNLQEAAVAALADLLKNHAESLEDDVLPADVQFLRIDAVAAVMHAIVDAMNAHIERRTLQEASCQSLALLYYFLPASDVLGPFSEAVLKSLRRHDQCAQVVDMAVWALYAFLEPQYEASKHPNARALNRERIATAAQNFAQQGLAETLGRALERFPDHSNIPVRVLYVLAIVLGLDAVLDAFESWHKGKTKRKLSGLKAFEAIVRNLSPDVFLVGATSQRFQAMLQGLAQLDEDLQGPESELQQKVELLTGLLYVGPAR